MNGFIRQVKEFRLPYRAAKKTAGKHEGKAMGLFLCFSKTPLIVEPQMQWRRRGGQKTG